MRGFFGRGNRAERKRCAVLPLRAGVFTCPWTLPQPAVQRQIETATEIQDSAPAAARLGQNDASGDRAGWKHCV